MNNDQLESSKALTKAQGEAGERFALAYERKRIPEQLHDKIVCFGDREVALGYDILSLENTDDMVPERCIEVKTFRGQPHFYWTDNEIVTARNNGEHFYLYLVDYDSINETCYEPIIIPNPFLVFKDFLPAYYSDERQGIPHSRQWAIQIPYVLITLLTNENIPDDWDDSIVLLGCIKDERHLKWIRSHMLYNVRTQKNIPGSVDINSSLVQNAKYLLLYSVSNPQVYYLYSLQPNPYLCSQQHLIDLGYPNPRCYSYIIHPLAQKLGTFFINLAPLLRKINHKYGNTYGTPQYFLGSQLRQIMACDKTKKEATGKLEEMVFDKSKEKSPEKPKKKASSHQQKVVESHNDSKYEYFWSEEEDSLFVDLLMEHTPISEIAAQLHHSVSYTLSHMGFLRSRNIINAELYFHYYDNDPAFAFKKKYNETNRHKH